jgi:hypothetical protein
MIADKKTFSMGALMLTGFLAVLVAMFMPLFGGGQNALNVMDNLYNSISKGSAYYIPGLIADNQDYLGREISVSIKVPSADQAENTAKLFWKAGVAAEVNGDTLAIKGGLGKITGACLEDADALFGNRGEVLQAKYGYDPRQVGYNWWQALKAIGKDLTRQKHFAEAKWVATVQARAVECAYNYYQIEPQKITDKVGIVIFSLVFYVIYTLWFGFSIMYLFEGWGMDLGH